MDISVQSWIYLSCFRISDKSSIFFIYALRQLILTRNAKRNRSCHARKDTSLLKSSLLRLSRFLVPSFAQHNMMNNVPSRNYIVVTE